MVENGWAERKELSQNISIDFDFWILWTLFLDNDQSVKIGWLVSWQVCATERFVFTLLDGVLNVLPADIQSAAAVELCKDVSWADQMFSNKLANWDEVTSWYIMLNPNCHMDLFGVYTTFMNSYIFGPFWTIWWTIWWKPLSCVVQGEANLPSQRQLGWRGQRRGPWNRWGVTPIPSWRFPKWGVPWIHPKLYEPFEIYVHVCLFIYNWH